MRVIIVGCGRLGAHLANLLCIEGHEVVVIDRDPDAFRRLREDFSGRKLTGIGFDREVLIEAGIEEADALVAVTRGDNHNIVTALAAKNAFRVPRVIARIYDQERAKLYWRLGVETVAPVTWTANTVRDYLFHREFRQDSAFGNSDVVMIEVACPQHLIGKPAADLAAPQRIQIGVIVRDGTAFIPTPGTVLQAGDFLHVLVASEAVSHFKEIIEGS